MIWNYPYQVTSEDHEELLMRLIASASLAASSEEAGEKETPNERPDSEGNRERSLEEIEDSEPEEWDRDPDWAEFKIQKSIRGNDGV